MRAMAPKGSALQRYRNARGHGPLLQVVQAATAILPSLPTFGCLDAADEGASFRRGFLHIWGMHQVK